MTPDQDELEALLVRLLHHVGQELPVQGVVKGGLVLRLLDCPRRTNDLDLVLVPYGSKRDAAPRLQQVLEAFPCDSMEITTHSTAIRARLRQGKVVAQVEASVAEECPSQPMSTSSLATQHRELPRVVRVMRFEDALAHKLGAWMERGLMRDLYDVFYWHGVQGVMPDPEILRRRLASARPRKGRPKEWDMERLRQSLVETVGELADDDLRAELQPVLPEIELVGLAARIRGAVRSLALRLAEVDRAP
ncbi:MAG TPA: nucleotidyl transferase AbiEii/AbiGii toxin family protein [Fibrobacteria bacterium]|nr:nucleotidyl transferase AbiEii/AbiGii toxin family protein [Fibrobacteria bacterium]